LLAAGLEVELGLRELAPVGALAGFRAPWMLRKCLLKHACLSYNGGGELIAVLWRLEWVSTKKRERMR